MVVKQPITGSKYVEYVAEDRVTDPDNWGVLPTTPTFVWLGLAEEFVPPHKEIYEEKKYLGASAETHTLELKRSINTGVELNASLKYIMQDWAFIQYITGSLTTWSDTVDSISVVSYADAKWTVLTGGMLTKWALNIPAAGIATVDVDMMFADVTAPSDSDPSATGHSSEATTAPYTWKDVTLLKMCDAGGSPASLTDIVGGLTMTINSEVEMSKGVDSTYDTKGVGATVNCRDIEISLDLTYVDIEVFRALVVGHEKQDLTFTLGTAATNGYKVEIEGLLFPEWVAELKPCELIGQTVTAITDLPVLKLTALV